MLFKAKLALQYIRYRFLAKKLHGVHSPFVYRFSTDVLYDTTPYYSFTRLNLLRRSLLEDSSVLDILDLGVGSKTQTSNKRSVKSIAHSALSEQKYMELYFRMINYFKSRNVLELGTSLGLTTSYLAHVSKDTRITTIEGSPSLAKFSTKLLRNQKLSNVTVLEGDFDKVIPTLIDSQSPPFDFVFIDGNHSYEATLKYFNQLLEKCSNNAVIIFDDIRWSEGMLRAWSEIKSDKRIQVSLDLFKVGIVFIREGQEKEDFLLSFS